MLTMNGNGRLTRKPELRETKGDPVTTVTVASDRRKRDEDPIYVDLVLWGKQAEAAAEHLEKGQAVAFTGRFEPRPYTTRNGDDRVAFEVHNVDLEYGAKARGDGNGSDVPPEAPETGSAEADKDIPF